MKSEELAAYFKDKLPVGLATDLVSQFLSIRQDVTTGTLERSAPGKFVETIVQVIQYLDRGTFDAAPKVDDYLKNLEGRPANLPDDLRLTVARVARAMYTLRNKRGIAHKSGIDPNIYDLKYLFASAQWVLSEILRHILASDVTTSSRLVEFVQLPADPLVEDFGDRRLVLTNGTATEELLLLLRHYYPETVPVSQIHRDLRRRKASTVSNAIRAAYEKKHVEGDKPRGYKLSALGYQAASDLVKRQFSHQY